MKKLALIALLLLLQNQTGSISGQIRVLDPAAPPIVSANVRIQQQNGSYTFETNSDESGSFFVSDVPAGRHTVTVSTGGETVSDVCEVKAGEECKLVFEF